jgi:hypothetical protein
LKEAVHLPAAVPLPLLRHQPNTTVDTNDGAAAGSRKMLGSVADVVSHGEEATVGVAVGRVGDETGDNRSHLTQQTADARNRLQLGVATDLEPWNLRRHSRTHLSQNLYHA